MKKNYDIIFTGAVILVILLALQAVTGKMPFTDNVYNSYYLQAQSWLHRHLDLGRDYPHLELAVYGGKYYVSFPPFPSYVMIPFAALSLSGCDWLLALISSVTGGVYAAAIMKHFGKSERQSIFWGLFVTIGSNWLFTALVPWVWFIAQNMAFTLSIAAIYYALKGKAGISLSLWACSVGCRPFQAIYVIVLFYLLYKSYREKHLTLRDMIKTHWRCLIAPFIIAASYMALNFARFGNIFEFGHNYLPEFTRTETGQFNVSYLKENIAHLFKLPQIIDGEVRFQSADGFCIFIASPIFISYIIYLIRYISDKQLKQRPFICFMFILLFIHLLMISMHKTMGGSHYGNRYTNDALPFVFLSLAYMIPERGKYETLNLIPFLTGFMLNCIWTYMYY